MTLGFKEIIWPEQKGIINKGATMRLGAFDAELVEGSKVSKLYNYPNKKTISFVGNIGALQNPIVFIELMDLFKQKGLNNFIFLLNALCLCTVAIYDDYLIRGPLLYPILK